MSFDDLQKTWGRQQFGDDAALQAAVLEKVRQRERLFRWILLVGIIRDAAVLVVLGAIVWANWQGVRLPPSLLLGIFAVFTAGLMIMLRLSKSLTGELMGGAGALADQVGRDSARFKRLMLWGNVRELIACVCGVWCVGVNAARATDYPALHWISVGFLALAGGTLLVRMLLIERGRPKADHTITGDLAASIYYARAQMRLLGNLWWYFAPVYVAGALWKLSRVLDGQVSWENYYKSLPAVVVVLWVAWAVNRRLVKRRLQPRAEFLERLHAQLTGADSP